MVFVLRPQNIGTKKYKGFPFAADWVAVRAACPACLNERDPGDSQCQYCGVQFFELIPDEIVKRRQIQRFCRGQQYDDTLPTVHHLRYTEAM